MSCSELAIFPEITIREVGIVVAHPHIELDEPRLSLICKTDFSLRRKQKMLWTILVILLVLWLIGLLGGVGGNLIHLLLVVAVVVLVINLLTGRRAV